MSRGLGKREREILAQLTESPKPIGGATRSERVSNRRAARSLERRGLADVFVFWNLEHTHGVVCAVRAGAVTEDGKTWKSLNVACAPPPGAQATVTKRMRLQGSLRSLAEKVNVSVATIRRDLAKAKDH